MSLRARVVMLIAAILMLSLALGTLVAGYQAREALRAELTSGLDGGQMTVITAFEDLPNSDHPDRDLRQLVDTFNGNRHVRAALLGDDGAPARVSSTPMAERHAPQWFQRLLGPAPPNASVAVPAVVRGFRSIVLSPVPELDAAVAWRQLIGVILTLTGLTAAGVVAVYLLLGAALAPLTALAAQFERIGLGDYSARVAEKGPAELLALERGFNRMATDLDGANARNRMLTRQLADIQEEERADIARDLHDEFGPHLFAINVDAETIVQMVEAGRAAAAPAQARAIQGAVGHMQRQVRELLGRLRPANATELGLKSAVVDLIRFWKARRPDILFSVSLVDDDHAIAEAARDVAYRVVQEATSNAVRHGAAKTIRIAMTVEADGALRVRVTDDGAAPTAGGKGGLGLVGMGERVAAAGGSLSYGPNADAPGWSVEARLPLAPAAIKASA